MRASIRVPLRVSTRAPLSLGLGVPGDFTDLEYGGCIIRAEEGICTGSIWARFRVVLSSAIFGIWRLDMASL